MRVLLAALALAGATGAFAGSISFANVCTNYRLTTKAGDLLVYCPGQALPWLTIKSCPKPSARKDAAGNLWVACN